jgi:DNA-binding GntR family transcriptional regulator
MTIETARPIIFSPRPKLGEEVTRYLRDAIMSGEYGAGQRILLEELAGRLDVSTMPVREALTALVNEGLLEGLPRRGYRVASIRSQDIDDVFALHSFIAGLLAERSAKAIDAAGVEGLHEIQRRAEQVARKRLAAPQRAAQIEEINFRFHRTINKVPDASRLRWFLRAATRYVPRHFYLTIPRWAEATLNDHPPIMDALARHDGATARKLMEEHITRAGRLVVEHLTAEGIWSSRGGAPDGVRKAARGRAQ